MTSKTRWIACIVLLGAAALFASGYYRAGIKEWELLNRVPTTSVADSKRLGVYITNLNFSPAEVDLGDTRYKLDEVWAEHRTDVERVSLFTVRQKNQPDIVLCVRMHAIEGNQALAVTGVRISTPKANRTYQPPFTGNLCVDAGVTMPGSFSLSSVVRDAEVRIALSQP